MGKGGGHAPELRPQQVPSGASRMKQNLLAAAAPIQTTLGELTTLPQTPWLAGKGLAAPYPRTPTTALAPGPK